MRWTASVLGLTLCFAGLLATGPASAEEICSVDPIDSTIDCHDSGTTPGTPGDPRPDPDRTGPRYVYAATDAAIGDCHYWSNVPGGLDAWDPADDAAVIAANALPVCPGGVAPVDVPATAWQIFRSWNLDPPDPSLEPAVRGITGLPTFLASPDPVAIGHSETLPDGRPLQVRARVAQLRIDWGDDTRLVYDPTGADPYPTEASHTPIGPRPALASTARSTHRAAFVIQRSSSTRSPRSTAGWGSTTSVRDGCSSESSIEPCRCPTTSMRFAASRFRHRSAELLTPVLTILVGIAHPI